VRKIATLLQNKAAVIYGGGGAIGGAVGEIFLDAVQVNRSVERREQSLLSTEQARA